MTILVGVIEDKVQGDAAERPGENFGERLGHQLVDKLLREGVEGSPGGVDYLVQGVFYELTGQ